MDIRKETLLSVGVDPETIEKILNLGLSDDSFNSVVNIISSNPLKTSASEMEMAMLSLANCFVDAKKSFENLNEAFKKSKPLPKDPPSRYINNPRFNWRRN